MLSDQEKFYVRNIIANYSEAIMLSAINGDPVETMHSHMTDFYLLFVRALTLAKMDGKMSALTTTLN